MKLSEIMRIIGDADSKTENFYSVEYEGREIVFEECGADTWFARLGNKVIGNGKAWHGDPAENLSTAFEQAKNYLDMEAI